MHTAEKGAEKTAAGTNLFSHFALETEKKTPAPAAAKPAETGQPKPTEPAAPSPAAETTATPSESDKQDDTKEIPPAKPKLEFEKDDTTPKADKQDDPPVKKPKTAAQQLSEAEASADFIVASVDTLQTFGFKKVLTIKCKKKLGGAKELADMLDLCDEILEETKTLNELTPDQRIAVRIAGKYMEKIEAVPFTEDETNRLIKAVMRWQAEQPDFQIPAWAQLLISFGTVLGQRAGDLLD